MKVTNWAPLIIALFIFFWSFSDASHAEGISLGQFQEMLERVLATNPEIVKTALLRAEAIESAHQAAEAKAAVAELVKQAHSLTSPMPTVGSSSSTSMIVEVIDYRCPYCIHMHAQIAEVLRQRPDVRVAFVLTSILGKDSDTLARFALAADEQGKFRTVHDALFSSAKPIDGSEAGVKALAVRTGVNWTRAKAAMDSEAITLRMNSMQKSWEALKRPGTPLVIVGNDVFAGVTLASEIVRSMKSTNSIGTASR